MPTIKQIKEKVKKKYWSNAQRQLHILGYPITKLFLSLGVSPNTVTLMWIFVQIIGALIISTGNYIYMVIGVFIFNLSFVLDAVDGQIARYINQTSLVGYYYDKLAHFISTPALFICLGIAVFKQTSNHTYLILGIIIGFSHILIESIDFNGFWKWGGSQKAKEEIKKVYDSFRASKISKNNKLTKNIMEFLKRGQIFNFILFGLILNIPHVVMIVYSIMFPLKLVFKLNKQIEKLKKIDKIV
jgi:phosphatidylglycerophosphate synthase